MQNLDMDLEEYPYMVATHAHKLYIWKAAEVDEKRRYRWPSPWFNSRYSQKPDLVNRLPDEQKSYIWFGEETWRIGGREKEQLGMVFKHEQPVEDRMMKGDDVPLDDLPIITFGWRGTHLIRAYPICSGLEDIALSRKELAALSEKIIEQYFLWALAENKPLYGIPPKYTTRPLDFIHKYARVCGLMKLTDGSWAPFLWSTGYVKEANCWYVDMVDGSIPQRSSESGSSAGSASANVSSVDSDDKVISQV